MQPAAQSAAPSASTAVVLLVDDTPLNLDVLGMILTQAGYRIETANSAMEAVEKMDGSLPDLILLDVMMPDMDGYELCRRLKADPNTNRIPIIFISARHDTADKVTAFEVGGADYVTKPFQAAEVLARVKYQIKLAQLQQAIERQNQQLMKINRALLESQSQTAAVFSALSEHLVGRTLDGKYRIEEKIGGGGFGVVYRATHLTLKRPVAIKVFRPSRHMSGDENLQRFLLEGISACRIDHPNAVAILDSGISREGIAYLVMELLRGATLSQEMSQKGRLPLGRCAEIIIPICRVLAEAHAAGVIHRDIKPDNVFLHQSASGEVIKVVDFGIAKLIGDSAFNESPNETGLGRIIGTPIYMAPERLRSEQHDGRADVYSVAVMLYQMLTGRWPCGTPSEDLIRVIYDQVHTPPRSMRAIDPMIPENVERAVLSALAKDPEVRPNARQFLHMLQDTMGVGLERPGYELPEDPDIDPLSMANTDQFAVGEIGIENSSTMAMQHDPSGVQPIGDPPRRHEMTLELDQRTTRLLRLREQVPERMRALLVGLGSSNAHVVQNVAADLATLCTTLGSEHLALLFTEIKEYGERNELLEVASMLSQIQQELAAFEQALTENVI